MVDRVRVAIALPQRAANLQVLQLQLPVDFPENDSIRLDEAARWDSMLLMRLLPAVFWHWRSKYMAYEDGQ